MNNFEAVNGAMKGASRQEKEVLTPDKLTLSDIAARIEQNMINGASRWEQGYWEDLEQREVDRINRDRLGNLALRRSTPST